MYDVILISHYIIDYCNGNGYFISNLKLQKLLYFVQIKFLLEKEVLCFQDDIVAVDFGVIVPLVYQKYFSYGSSMIPHSMVFNRKIYPITEEDKDIIDGVIMDVGNYSSTILLKRILSQDVWKQAYYSSDSKVISRDDISKYLEKKQSEKPVVKAKIYSLDEYRKKMINKSDEE